MADEMPLFDSHAHLTDPRFDDDRDAVLARAAAAGVAEIVCIGAGYGWDGNEPTLALAEREPRVMAAVGLHPQQADLWDAETGPARLRAWAAHPQTVALGETGLDYAYRKRADKRQQRDAFVGQCRLARELNLPLIIHTRDAFEDTVAILRDAGMGAEHPCVIHFFVGNQAQAETFLDMGLWLSIPGVVTLPNAPDLVQAVPSIPLERMLVETDSPYAAPVPRRGRRNEPAYVRYVVDKIAELKQVAPATVAAATRANAAQFFGVAVGR